MEQKDIDIYEILKDEEYGTELYTPKCGNVWHSGMANDKDSAKAIWTEDGAGREHFFDKNGKIYKEGEVLLFPSKQMRDWSKFFKKGDVLEYVGDKKLQGTCTFEKYEDETKTRFFGRFVKEKEVLNPNLSSNFRTVDWVKKHYDIWKNGKEEKEQPAFKTFDKVLVRDGGEYEWLPALFVRDRGEGANYRYKVLSLRSGKPAEFACCIPYEGNENIIFTDHNIDNLPF
jgi:hypothetical protein